MFWRQVPCGRQELNGYALDSAANLPLSAKKRNKNERKERICVGFSFVLIYAHVAVPAKAEEKFPSPSRNYSGDTTVVLDRVGITKCRWRRWSSGDLFGLACRPTVPAIPCSLSLITVLPWFRHSGPVWPDKFVLPDANSQIASLVRFQNEIIIIMQVKQPCATRCCEQIDSIQEGVECSADVTVCGRFSRTTSRSRPKRLQYGRGF
jgi:hypothetical protein